MFTYGIAYVIKLLYNLEEPLRKMEVHHFINKIE